MSVSAFGAALVVALALVALWRREVSALVTILSLQGLALGVVAWSLALTKRDLTLVEAGSLVVLVKAILVPFALSRVLRRVAREREGAPVINVPSSLVVGALLVSAAVVVTRGMVHLDPSPLVALAPYGVATSLIGYFVVVTRRRAVSQIVGLVMVDNGIALTTFVLTAGVPMVLELGGALDVLLVVVVLQGVRSALGPAALDLSQLRELHE